MKFSFNNNFINNIVDCTVRYIFHHVGVESLTTARKDTLKD